MRYLFGFSMLLLIAGCSSEVDKCVEAEVKAWKAEQSRIAADVAAGRKTYAQGSNPSPWSAFDKSIVQRDERTTAEVEAQSRRVCLHIANNKKD